MFTHTVFLLWNLLLFFGIPTDRLRYLEKDASWISDAKDFFGAFVVAYNLSKVNNLDGER